VHLAAHHDVTLVCHPQYRAETDPALPGAANPFRIVYAELPRMIDPWKPERSERGVRLHYMLWLRAALRCAARLHRERPFDIVHQVGLGSVSAPSPFWQLGIPLVWGPLGGGQTPPPRFRLYFGDAWGQEVRRAWRLRVLPYWQPFRRAVARAALVMGTNHETLDLLRRAGAVDPLLFPDSGADAINPGRGRSPKPAGAETVLLWAGRLERHKALPLALEALAKVTAPVKLLVAGQGPLRDQWERLARTLGLHKKVEFLGMVPSHELHRRFQEADAFLFTSLRDSTGSVIWQAAGEGLPVIALDHHGVGALMPREAALKVPVDTPAITIAALAAAIEKFAAMGHRERASMGDAAIRVAAGNSWPRRAAAMTGHYERILGAAPAGVRFESAVATSSVHRSGADR
jgi:glycosyltransferase involved in cell wall biosynthesis